ncbi:hypothetical protein GCM10028816_53880 [Spirosoma lituiforme]
MRLLLIVLITFGCSTQLLKGQTRPTTKLYLYNPYVNLHLAIDPDNVLKTASGTKIGYVLIETDSDSLGLKDPSGQLVYLVLELGKTYYYGYDFRSITYKEMSPNAFWLSVAAWSRYHYHYSITKQSGVIKIE